MKDEYYLDPRSAASYELDSPGLPGDVEFYMRLAREASAAGHAVLELACGTGRVAIPIAKEGIDMVGLDRSAAMLDVARSRAEGIDNLRLMEGDMAGFDLGMKFGLAFIPYRSFLHLMTVDEQKGCLESARRHLVDGGRLALNFFNPDFAFILATDGMQRREREVQPGTVRWASMRYDKAHQTVDKVLTDDRLGEGGVVVSRIHRKIRYRYVFRYEMEHLLALTGFEVESLYGGFKGEPFADDSSEMVWVARKA